MQHFISNYIKFITLLLNWRLFIQVI